MMQTTYSTSKHGVLGYWKSVCQELKEQGDEQGFQWVLGDSHSKSLLTNDRFYAICPFFASEW